MFWATIDSTNTIKVDHITPVGIIVSEQGGDEYVERLIPWHRVVSVQCSEPGAIRLELGE